MPPTGPTYYEVLGLLPGAPAADIRKRYRELARRYHPDVARTPDAARRFTEINEAHSVLSDPAKRANYDASLKLQEFRRANEQTRRQGDRETGRQETGDRRQETGRPAPSAQRPTPNTQHPIPEHRTPNTEHRTPNTAQVAGLLEQARKAMARRRFREAELLCRQANRARRTSEAFEMLGDVCRARGRTDEAVAMYSYALQLDRANHSAQAKFDKLVGKPSGPTMAGHAARAASAARSPLRAGSGAAQSPARALATGVGLLIIAFLVAVVALTRNPPATSAWVFEWDGLLVFALAASGAVAGFLGAANGLMAPARAELCRAGRGRTLAVPLGAVLLAFDALSFYAAAVVYAILSAFTGSASCSVGMAFGAALALAAVFAAAAPVSARWILLSGPNVVFFALVLGWAAGMRDEG